VSRPTALHAPRCIRPPQRPPPAPPPPDHHISAARATRASHRTVLADRCAGRQRQHPRASTWPTMPPVTGQALVRSRPQPPPGARRAGGRECGPPPRHRTNHLS
jgi:hypothetical protein